MTDNPSHILEQEVISSLLHDKHYFNSCINHLDTVHFTEPGMGLVFGKIKNHYLDYGNVPSLKEIILNFKDATNQEKVIVKDTIKLVKDASDVNQDLLLSLTEKFIKSAIFAQSVILGADALGSHDEDKMAESFAIAEDASDAKVNVNDRNSWLNSFLIL